MKTPPSQNDADESAAAPCTDLLLCTQITYTKFVQKTWTCVILIEKYVLKKVKYVNELLQRALIGFRNEASIIMLMTVLLHHANTKPCQ